MPEVGIGLVPDVGGSALLAAAPGHLGEYLGTTATRMSAGDAIYVGFADHFIPLNAFQVIGYFHLHDRLKIVDFDKDGFAVGL